MIWPSVIAALAGLGGVALGFAANMVTTNRQAKHQTALGNIAAMRDYARRADEHYRPHFDTVLAAARTINAACSQYAEDFGDIDALDRCIDHLECSPLTRPVASAATDLRNAAIAYRSELEIQHALGAFMPPPGSGAPLNPEAGKRIADHSEQLLEPARDIALAATYRVREAVKAVVARLEADQHISAT